MIRPNCRVQFTTDDFEFISSTLSASKANTTKILHQLFTDNESLDIILDDERLFQRVLTDSNCIKISPNLYFYLLVRRALIYVGIDDRVLSDYLGALLTEYARSERSRRPATTDGKPIQYFTDAIAAMEKADDKMRFFIQLFIANYSLFIAGIFPKYLDHRNKFKASPTIEYYEKMGKVHFDLASRHFLAHKHELTQVLRTLAEYFGKIRLALNDLTDRFVFIESPGY